MFKDLFKGSFLILFVHLVRFVALNLGITWLTILLALYFCEKVVYDFTLLWFVISLNFQYFEIRIQQQIMISNS